MRAPSYRVLLVLDAIGEHGPISLNGLGKVLPSMSRASIWRAAAVLRDYGWVRTRLTDNAFELTSKLDFTMANAHFAHEATECVVEEIQRCLDLGANQVTAGMFVSPGQFEVIETTITKRQIGVPLSLVFDDFAFAAQSQMEKTALLKHLTAYLARPGLSNEEVTLVQTGQHVRDLFTSSRSKETLGYWFHTGNTNVFMLADVRRATHI